MELDELLTQVEELSSQALELASVGNMAQAARLVEARAAGIKSLTEFIAMSGPLSFTHYNRLVVIHRQGDRIAAVINGSRLEIAKTFIDTVREHAYLERISAVVETSVPAQLSETA